MCCSRGKTEHILCTYSYRASLINRSVAVDSDFYLSLFHDLNNDGEHMYMTRPYKI